MGEALLDLGVAHFGGMAFCPVKVGLLGAVGGMFEAQDVAHLVEEFFRHRALNFLRVCFTIQIIIPG